MDSRGKMSVLYCDVDNINYMDVKRRVVLTF